MYSWYECVYIYVYTNILPLSFRKKHSRVDSNNRNKKYCKLFYYKNLYMYIYNNESNSFEQDISLSQLFTKIRIVAYPPQTQKS